MEEEGRERFLKVVRSNFSDRLREQVKWLAEKCWTENLKLGLRDLGDIISTSRSLGATQADSFSEVELDGLTAELKKLRAENRFLEAEQLLRRALLKNGVSAEVLGL